MRARSLRGVLLYYLGVIVVCVAVALFVEHVSRTLLVAGLAVSLSLLGALLFLRRRREPRLYARWREVMPCYLSIQDRDLKITDINDLFRREFGDRVGEHCYKVYGYK